MEVIKLRRGDLTFNEQQFRSAPNSQSELFARDNCKDGARNVSHFGVHARKDCGKHEEKEEKKNWIGVFSRNFIGNESESDNDGAYLQFVRENELDCKEKCTLSPKSPSNHERIPETKFVDENDELDPEENVLKRTITPFFQSANENKKRPESKEEKRGNRQNELNFEYKSTSQFAQQSGIQSEIKEFQNARVTSDSNFIHTNTAYFSFPKNTALKKVEEDKESCGSSLHQAANPERKPGRVQSNSTGYKSVVCKNVLKTIGRSKFGEAGQAKDGNGLNHESSGSTGRDKEQRANYTNIMFDAKDNVISLNTNWGIV